MSSLFNELQNSIGEESSLQRVGDLCREEENRPLLAGLIPALCKHVMSDATDTNIVALSMRALANLCFDDEANRSAVAGYEGFPERLVSLLSSSEEAIVRNCSGLVANVCSRNDGAQGALVAAGAVRQLVALLRGRPRGSHAGLAVRALSNCADNEALSARIGAAGGLPVLFALGAPALQCLATACASFDNALKLLHDDACFSLLLAWVRSDDETVAREAAAVLEELADREPLRSEWSSEQIAVLFNEPNDALAKAVATLSLDDSQATLLSAEHLQSIVDWVKSDVDTLRIAGLMAVGNICRSDNQCKLLLSVGIVPPLVAAARHSNVNLQHLAAGCLGNLAIPSGHPVLLLREGVLDALLFMVAESKNAHALFSAVVAIKRMVALPTCPPEMRAALEVSNGLDGMLEMTTRLQQDEHARIVHEVGRTIALMTLHDDASIVNNTNAVLCLIKLCSADWPLLQLEGARALAVLLAKAPTERRAELLEMAQQQLMSLLVNAENTEGEKAGAAVAAIAGLQAAGLGEPLVQATRVLRESDCKDPKVKEAAQRVVKE